MPEAQFATVGIIALCCFIFFPYLTAFALTLGGSLYGYKTLVTNKRAVIRGIQSLVPHELLGGAAEEEKSPRPKSRSASPSYLPWRSERIQHEPTIEEVQMELRRSGLESCSLILAVDYTRSNEWTGKVAFGGQCMHKISDVTLNPYQRVIKSVAATIDYFDDDHKIPAYGFGDKKTKGHAVFSIAPDEREPSNGVSQVLEHYNAITPKIELDGPTSFVPIIYKAMDIVRDSGNSFHILVIITDGAVTDPRETGKAIVEASKTCPLAIIVVGVGDGPWEEMETLDSDLPKRKFDNLAFVNYEQILRKHDGSDVKFALEALKEVGGQYKFCRDNDMLYNNTSRTHRRRGSGGH